jgi:hypothetical protein
MPKLTTSHPNLLMAENSLLLIVDQQTKLTAVMLDPEAATLYECAENHGNGATAK